MSIISNQIGTLEYLTAEGISVPHGFTTRYGGVSTGHLASLNIGLHLADSKNFCHLCLGFIFKISHQNQFLISLVQCF